MTTLEALKNKIAQKYFTEDWDQAMVEIATKPGSILGKIAQVEALYDAISSQYAAKCSEASLEKASENLIRSFDESILEFTKRKQSITNPENITLL